MGREYDAAALLACKAVFVDLDGTLVDSERLKAAALSAACLDFGGRVGPEAYADVMGGGWSEVRDHMCSSASLSVPPDAFDERFRSHYEALLRDEPITVTEGFEAFRARCAASGTRLGLVTAAPLWQVRFVLDKVGLGGAFERIVTREDVARHKPDPECYLKALDAFAVSPAEALVVEDTEAGLRAGLAAGCRVVIIRHAWNRSHAFPSARLVVRGFGELA